MYDIRIINKKNTNDLDYSEFVRNSEGQLINTRTGKVITYDE